MKYTKNNPLRVVTLCSGYDSQCLALNRLREAYPDFDYRLVAWSEWDPESKAPTDRQPAVIAHKALFPDTSGLNLGDMTKIDWKKVEDFDLPHPQADTPRVLPSHGSGRQGHRQDTSLRSQQLFTVQTRWQQHRR